LQQRRRLVRVLLVSANTERINMPTLPLGLALVAAATRQSGHEAAFLDLLTEAAPESAVEKAVRTFSPEVVGISVRNVDDQDIDAPEFLLERVKDVVSACRAFTNAPIVLGGPGYSIFPEAALAYLEADFGICGEGERIFPALLDRLQQGDDLSGLPGLYVAGEGPQAERRFEPDLDRLPFPLDDLWSSADTKTPELWVPVQARRGCPLACTYCSTGNIEGRTVRFRSPERVAQHVARVAAAGFRRVYFVDNTFNLPPSYAMELCRAISAERLDIAWRCILYPHDVPEELVTAMAKAGCTEVSLGFESGSKRVLRAMNKQFGPEEVREISDRLAAHGIRRLGFLLLGGPGETKRSVEESLDFADSLCLDMLKTTIGIRIYPQTPLARQAVEEGMIAPDDDLLLPRFYLRPELKTYIREVVASRGK
jgi:radical SAM superfamily enzyme YgiQ (UPF0313 family)